ncbi:hypothetical protein [Flavobacterium algicola]|uniref:hypothetical protein n=1 Tax=Flavobacterium algicola TaxID=556529 RepID=UPI001EFC6046|nr:hypothetical protein [Flavobacterium algicola]MCG9792513.1 hypothetical protein [Flavobacterium algicola]
MKNKDTKTEPKLTIRETETINRFETFYKCSEILREFFRMGFKSFEALKAIMLFHYPDIDLVRLKRFWNCQLLDRTIVEKVITVFEKLKNE